MLRLLLAHPLARRAVIDEPSAVEIRREIIAGNAFLQAVYRDWYDDIAAVLPAGPDPVLEIGSGAGFMNRHVEGLITSDFLKCGGIDLVIDASQLPFGDGALRGIALTNVLHHLHDVGTFLDEAARCVRQGGVVAMIEPWATTWSRIVYGRLHHEPFMPDAADWTISTGGPLSGANGAQPWILFSRDRKRFENEFPVWRIDSVEPRMPFRYLLSGGVSLRPLLPGLATPFFRGVEKFLSPWAHHLGMFARIVLTRVTARP